MKTKQTIEEKLEDLSGKACLIEKHEQAAQRLVESFRQDRLRGAGPTESDVDSLAVIAEDIIREAKDLLEGAQAVAGSL